MNIIENMGNADRLIRALLAVIFVGAFFNGLTIGILGIAVLIVACILLGTAIFGHSPLYSLMGWRTKATRNDTGH